MSDFDEIYSLKNGPEKIEKMTDYYKNEVKINNWLINDSKNSIINFRDRIEYKKNNQYHRLNGPAIDYSNESLNKYYYKGKLFETKKEWEKATIKELRRIKIKKLNMTEKENPD